MPSQKAIMLIDGLCNICTRIVSFTVRHDPKALIQFAALQSPVGQKLLAQYGLPTSEIKTFVLIENNQAYTHSTGALRYFKHLNGLWPLLYVLIVLPRPLRDFVYDTFSKNRYHWFGKRDQCLVPTPELKNRFLD